MGIFRRMASFLGLSDEDEEEVEVADAGDASSGRTVAARGFGVRAAFGPVIAPCDADEGSVQGFDWYTRRLRIDEDGDVADEFLVEVIAERQAADVLPKEPPKLLVNRRARPTNTVMGKQIIVAADGNIRQILEYQGRLRWV